MLIVRAATADDAEQISKLNEIVQRMHHEALPHLFKPASESSFPPATVRAIIGDSHQIVGLAETENAAIGYITARVHKRLESNLRFADSCLYVDHLAVREDARGLGVGGALMDFVEGRAASLGLASIDLDYWTFNKLAQSFFERRGFDAVNVRATKLLPPNSN